MRFDLSKYSTVAERLAKFHEDHPDGRIVTEWENTYDEVKDRRTWVIKSTIYLSAGDQANKLPKSTGYAFEIDGTGGANNTSALENAESSSIGRALMVMGYSMSKDPNTLASREEMQKVMRGRDYLAEASKLTDVSALRWLYAQAKGENASEEILEGLAERARLLSPGSEDNGAAGGVSGSPAKQPPKRGDVQP
jgi:hypothetical protein